MLISSLLSPKPKKNKDDLTPPTSQFGADLPRLFGKFSVGGNLYYARKPIGKKKGKGISRKASKPDENFLNCAVSICEGERHFNALVMDAVTSTPATYGLTIIKASFFNNNYLANPSLQLNKVYRANSDRTTPLVSSDYTILDYNKLKAYPNVSAYEIAAILPLDPNLQSKNFEYWFGSIPQDKTSKQFGITASTFEVKSWFNPSSNDFRYPLFQLGFYQSGKYYRFKASKYTTIDPYISFIAAVVYPPNYVNGTTEAINGLLTKLNYSLVDDYLTPVDCFASVSGELVYVGSNAAVAIHSTYFGTNSTSNVFNWNLPFVPCIFCSAQPDIPSTDNVRPVKVDIRNLNLSTFGWATTPANSLNTGICKLSKIWMQDKIWYDANATGIIKEDSDKHASYFTFYNGSLTQQADESLIAILGEFRVSALQGVVCVVFKNLPGGEWNGNYPTMKFEVESDLEVTPRVIINDIMCRAGYTVNKPLIEGRDYEILEDALIAPIPIDGYLLSQETGDYRNALADICQIFRLSLVSADIISNHAFNPSFRYIRYYPRPALLFIPIDGFNVNQNVDRYYRNLGAETQEYTIPEPFINGQKDIQSYPSGIDLSFFQPRLDYQRETTRAERVSRGSGEVRSISTNASWADRSKAGAFAIWLVKRAWRNANNYLTKVSFPIMPGIKGYGLAGKTERTKNAFAEWQPSTLAEAVFATTYVSKVVLGADGRSEATLVSTGVGVQDLVYTPNNINLGSIGESETSQSVIIWFEGVNLTANGANRTINVLVAPAIATTDLVTAVAIATSIDNQNLTTTSTTTAGNSIKLKVKVIRQADISKFYINTFDDYTVFEIVVPTGVALSNISQASALTLNSNSFYSPDLGLGSFTNATLVGVNTYRISGFVWNYKGSIAESERRILDLNTELWLLTAPVISLEVPATATSGELLYVHTRDASTIQNTYGKVFRNLNLAPRPVKNTLVQSKANGDLVISWEPGTSQLITVEVDIYQPPVADSLALDEYALAIYDATVTITRKVPVRTVTGILTPTYTYLIADQITDGFTGTPQDIRFEVKRLGVVSTAPFFSLPNEFGLTV
jgi:hypothetical protein